MPPVVCTFMGRKVEVRVVTFGTLMEANDVASNSGNVQDASWHTLAKSAHWQDTGEPVFSNARAVLETPATYAGELMRMARACSDVNRPDLGDMEPAGQSNGNGLDPMGVRPSL